MWPHKTVGLIRRAVGMLEFHHSCFILCSLYSRTLSAGFNENIKHKLKENAKNGELGSLYGKNVVGVALIF